MIGILPCAGSATRIHGLPKFLLPMGDSYLLQHHIRGMRAVGAKVVIGANPDNKHLLESHAEHATVYVAPNYATMTQTVLSAYQGMFEPFRSEQILFSMPDTYMPGPAVYLPLQLALVNGADVAVALFEARPGQHTQGGMCWTEGDQVTRVVDKEDCDWRYIWGALAWTPAFWQHLDPADPHVGYGLPRAIDAGMDVRAVVCEGGYWDCGTPERYFECIRSLEGANSVQRIPVT